MKPLGGGGPHRAVRLLLTVGLATCLVLNAVDGVLASEPSPGAEPSKLEAALLANPPSKVVDFWVTLRADADLDQAPGVPDWGDRGELVVAELQSTAEATQARLIAVLDERGIRYEPYWISNAVRVTGDRDLMIELAAYPEVERVVADKAFAIDPPAEASSAAEPQAVEWNIQAIGAPAVWSTFLDRGEGVVVVNLDTGVQFDHPALVGQYRGNVGGSFDHNYNWFDPAHVCGNPSLAPCDNNGHGTHTMGTMVGADPVTGNQVGVAPASRWIAAKGCESTSCSYTSLLASGQWLLAPTDLAGNNPRPDLRPNVVNNSWGGGGGDPFFQDIVTGWEAAGIFPVFSNGNSGPSCGTAGSPADYPNSYSVGAYDSAGAIASFSSRGSASSPTVKPNISAPGVNVRSSVPGGGYGSKSGTSMAGPHVAGAVALLWSAVPALVPDVALTRDLLDRTAVDVANLTCGGTAADNGVWGEGRLDVLAAVTLARTPAGTIEGSVTAGGAPAAGVVVQAVGPVTYSSITRPDGTYGMWLPVGTYQVTATVFGRLQGSRAVVITAGQTRVEDFDLPLAPSHRVAGSVHDAHGGPLGGATVSIDQTPLAAQVTDAGGGFAFEVVPEGTYEISVAPNGCHLPVHQALVVDDAESPSLVVAKKVDGFGYSCSVSNATDGYVEAGTVLPLTGDDSTSSVPLPFPFSFYGTSYATAHLSANGLVSFGAPSSSWTNVGIPSTSAPNAALYPYWDDTYVDASSSVRTQLSGSEPTRTFTIEWRNLRYHSYTAKRVDFEVTLHQSGRIDMRYRNISDDLVEQGNSATIGIENATGTVGLEFSYLRPTLPVGFSSLSFTTQASSSNTAPDAVDDLLSVGGGGTADVPVLANDSDPDGDALVLTAVSDPPHGAATKHADGTVTYVADAGYQGLDAFTYDIADPKGGTDRATVSVAVDHGVNRAPVAVDDAVSTVEDLASTYPVVSNDTDADGDPLVVTAVSSPSHGTAAIVAGSTITYAPAPDFSGADVFTYDVGDGFGASDQATVAVTVTPVNDAPRAVDDNVTTPEDASVVVAVLANDRDVEGDAMTVTRVFGALHGMGTIGAGGAVTYVPTPNFNGADSLGYDVSDSHGAVGTAFVRVTVTSVADPSVAVADTAGTGINTTVDIDVLANDSDADGGVLHVLGASDPPHGTTTIAAGAGRLFYSPDASFAGSDTFTYVVGDGNGPTATGTVTVTVSSKAAAIPLSVWTFPGTQGLDGVGDWIVPANAPTAGPGQMAPNYRYSVTFPFSDVTTTGTLSLSIEGAARYASFSITRASGAVDTVRIPYSWAPGRAYLLLAGHVQNGLWQATVMDWANGAQKVIGSLQAGPQLRTAYPLTLTYLSWAGFAERQCSVYPLVQADFMRPVGVRGGAMVYAGNPTASNRAGDCPSTNSSSAGVQVRYQLGQA